MNEQGVVVRDEGFIFIHAQRLLETVYLANVFSNLETTIRVEKESRLSFNCLIIVL